MRRKRKLCFQPAKELPSVEYVPAVCVHRSVDLTDGAHMAALFGADVAVCDFVMRAIDRDNRQIAMSIDVAKQIARKALEALASDIQNALKQLSDGNSEKPCNRGCDSASCMVCGNGDMDDVEGQEELDPIEAFMHFEHLARPMMQYLCENYHPHVTIVITPTNAELLEGKMSTSQIMDYVRD